MRRLLQLTGVPGVGKSRLMEMLQEREPLADVIDFGREYKNWLSQPTAPLDLEPKLRLRKFVDLFIFPREPAVVSSHLLHYRDGKFDYDADIEMYMNSSTYVLVVAPPEEIVRRRTRDLKQGVRKRDPQNTSLVNEHQRKTLDVARQLIVELGSSLHIIENREDGLDKAYQSLHDILKIL